MTALGRTGIDIFPLALGTNTFGWTANESASHEILDTFVEAGGNFIDSADVYSVWAPGNSGGESESLIGRWLPKSGVRDRVVLASKVSGHPSYPGLSAGNIKRGLARSLERLQTDYLDVFFAHYDDPSTPLEEAVGAFDELVKQGLVRQVGLSNFSAARIQEWVDIASTGGSSVPTVLQPNYNLLTRREFEVELRPLVQRHGLGVVPYFGLASGFLTGKYRTADDLQGSARSAFLTSYATEEGFAVVRELVNVAAKADAAPATVALAWLRQQPGVTAPLASVSRAEQLAPLIASAKLELSEVDLELLQRATESA